MRRAALNWLSSSDFFYKLALLLVVWLRKSIMNIKFSLVVLELDRSCLKLSICCVELVLTDLKLVEVDSIWTLQLWSWKDFDLSSSSRTWSCFSWVWIWADFEWSFFHGFGVVCRGFGLLRFFLEVHFDGSEVEWMPIEVQFRGFEVELI